MSLEVELAKEFISKIDKKADSNTELIYALNDSINSICERLKKVEQYIANKQSIIEGFVPERTEHEECNDDIIASR